MIILLRHGLSEGNEKNLFSGKTDHPLVTKGISQSIAVGKKIKKINFVPNLIFCSQLKRAIDTAILVSSQFSHSVPIKKDKRLNERNFGCLENCSIKEQIKKMGESWVLNLFYSLDFKSENGETNWDVFLRVKSFFNSNLLDWKNKNIMIVGHLTSLLCLYSLLSGENLEWVLFSKKLKNCEYFLF